MPRSTSSVCLARTELVGDSSPDRMRGSTCGVLLRGDPDLAAVVVVTLLRHAPGRPVFNTSSTLHYE
eukprot:8412394-Pyramimonas_sp.AAC.2